LVVQVVDHLPQVVRRPEKYVGWEIHDPLPRFSRDDIARRLAASGNKSKDVICEVLPLNAKEADIKGPAVLRPTRTDGKLIRHESSRYAAGTSEAGA